MSSSIEITPELLAGFLDEAPEYLEMLDAGMMEFESQSVDGAISLETPEDQERMNTMFRAAHSLKGLAAAFGFDKIKELTHRMETYFDRIRMGKSQFTSDSIETLFRVFDCLKLLVQELSDPSVGPVDIGDLLAALDTILDSAAAPPPAASCDAEPVQPTDPPANELTEQQNEIFGDPELAALFLETMSEALDDLNQGLLGLEESPSDTKLLNKVFRAAHNVKGASGAAGLVGMNRLTHDLETVFDQMRNGHLTPDDALMNAVFAGVDRLRNVLDAMRQGKIEDVELREIEGLYDKWTRQDWQPTATEAANGDQSAVTESGEGQSLSEPSSVTDGDPVPEKAPALDEGHVSVTVEFPEGFDEASIQAYLIHNKLNDFGTVVSSNPDLDTLAGDTPLTTIVFTLSCDTDPTGLEEILATYKVKSVRVAGSVGSSEHATEDPATETSAESESEGSRRAVVSDSPSGDVNTGAPAPAGSPKDMRPATTPEKSAGEAPPAASARPPASPSVAPPVSKPASTSSGFQSPAAPAKTVIAESATMKTTETVRVDLERLDQLMNLGGELVINRARFTQVHSRFREVFDGKNLGYLVDDIDERLKQLGSHVEELQSETQQGQDFHKLTVELVHLRDSFMPVRAVVERVRDLRGSMVDFDEAVHGLRRVSEGIQKGIMSTRMVPIGPLFTRFRRVVRDLCKTTGKQVNLVLRGENTELDKRMIDELGDPLTHMVRNSLDHGIETPEKRTAAGKPPEGTLILEACHRGNSICIQVTDDGAGLNVELIKAKALERGLETQEKLDSMSDRELNQFIFRPGFSTAAKVTEVSGRGMGMDIVVNKIEKLSGTIDVDSTPGQGSSVTIKLPLTLAILNSMVARIGQGTYALPLETVAEIITVRQSEIQYIQRREVVRVRERVVPIIWFEDVFGAASPGMKTEGRHSDELTLMIIGYEDDKVGLVVDELLGQEDVVIKSIAENYTNVRGIAGASIRGDGRVSLILDVAAMMEMAAKAATASSARQADNVATDAVLA